VDANESVSEEVVVEVEESDDVADLDSAAVNSADEMFPSPSVSSDEKTDEVSSAFDDEESL